MNVNDSVYIHFNVYLLFFDEMRDAEPVECKIKEKKDMILAP